MKKFFKGVLIFILIIILCGAGMGGYIVWDNYRVVNTEYTYASEKVPKEFDGYKICVVADFHSSPNYKNVISAVEKAKPDLICICGDLINMEDTEFSNAEMLLNGLGEIADVVYAYGNHEVNCERKKLFEGIAENTKTELINDKVKVIEKDGAYLNIAGYGDDIYSDFTEHFEMMSIKRLEKISSQLVPDAPTILIMHRPQYFETVSQYPFDLVLSGHLHGGLVNIEKIRNMVLEEHFATTKYCKGEYFENDSELIISAGIAKEDKIYRIFNTPEIVTVEVRSLENTDS